MTRNRRIILGSVTTAVAVIAVGAFAFDQLRPGDRFAACQTAVISGGLDALGGPFTLTDETGARVTDKDVFSQPALLYFGYTFCPDVCPTDSARNAVASDILKEAGHNVRPVFITVDPKRDTPDAVRQFTDALHPDMLGLTGTDEEIATVNKEWRNYYKAHDDGTDPYYLVDHMTNTFLVLPKMGTVEFFNRDISGEELADRVACFLETADV